MESVPVATGPRAAARWRFSMMARGSHKLTTSRRLEHAGELGRQREARRTGWAARGAPGRRRVGNQFGGDGVCFLEGKAIRHFIYQPTKLHHVLQKE
jgi:hypothetical protein